MSQNTRRRFLQGTAAAGVGYWVAGGVSAKETTSPNEKIRFACIGIGGKGSSDSSDAGRNGDVVAICDIDEQRLSGASKKFKDSTSFTDYRVMLDKMHKNIDAVTVSTPDHTHGPAALMAMNLDKHCFTQKPLTHSIAEAREMAELARKKGLATQMGNQGTSSAGLRESAAVLKSDTLGKVTECHCWTNRPVWPQGGPRPKTEPVPSHIKWDNWIGTAPFRDYAPGYHPFKWRGYWDFGTGALGDMACHTLNMPYMGLDLFNPTSVEAQSSGHNKDTYPTWSTIKFVFPANDIRGEVVLYWYDGKKDGKQNMPEDSLFTSRGGKSSRTGSLTIGSKGALHSKGDYGQSYELLGDIEKPKVEYVKSPGHFTEFANAIKGGAPAVSNFADYSGGLTETILLGNLAVWATGKKVEWDAKNLKSTNMPELEAIVRPENRKEFKL